MSTFRSQGSHNSGDNVFRGVPGGKDEPTLFSSFLATHDFSANSRRAFIQDIRSFALWFTEANREAFTIGRVTTRDISDFKDHQRRAKGKAVATVNRSLVTLRRF